MPKYAPDDPAHDFDFWFVKFNFELVSKYMRGSNVLEMGCFAGLSTLLLSDRSEKLTVVDLSQENIDLTRRRMDDAGRTVSLVCSSWEDYGSTERYSDIMLWRGLEHVVEPVSLLERIRTWLEPGGLIHVVVPNATSLHRRIGVQMGYLQEVHELNERDQAVGHQRVYDRPLLCHHLKQAGFAIYHWEGVFLKPLSNDQMKAWDEKLIRAFFELGRELPDYCAENYVCATPS